MCAGLNGHPLPLPSGEGVFKYFRDISQLLMHFLTLAGWLPGYYILFCALSVIPLKYY
jgi:hypothetical protein